MKWKKKMKTDYPDLERSENVSFWKHLLNWFWNKPRWVAEELFAKYFLATKRELQKTKLELVMLKYKVEQLEIAAEMRSGMEKAENVTNLFEERVK